MSLATKLKDLRVKSGQSLQQVADGVSVSKAHIWQLERGDSTNPSPVSYTHLTLPTSDLL